uniref:Uncharacterized protein n=1 Tax=Arundo donax TaxID=35708 RepID=A0A0A9G8V1_ARUDO
MRAATPSSCLGPGCGSGSTSSLPRSSSSACRRKVMTQSGM